MAAPTANFPAVLPTIALIGPVAPHGELAPPGLHPDYPLMQLRAEIIALAAAMGLNTDGAAYVAKNPILGPGFPRSGTLAIGADGAGYAAVGREYIDTTRGTRWVNIGDATNVYWVPTSLEQPGMWGVHDDFRDIHGTALSDTATSNVRRSGVTVIGDGVAETDSGAIENANEEGGSTLRLTASATSGKLVGLTSRVVATGQYQPDTHGMAIVEAQLTNVSAITARRVGIGFVGLAAVGLVSPVTGATTVATLVQDDLALMLMDTGFTDVDNFILAYNKSDAAASMTAVDTAIALAAAGTYQKLRMEIEPNPADATKVLMRAFIDGVYVGGAADALDEDEEACPILYIASLASAIKAMDVRYFNFFAGRA